MTAHLLLDEMFSATAAERLRGRGINATAIDEQGELRSISDAEVLALAQAQGRVVVTFNVADFLRLDRTLQASGETHNGIVLISSKSFSHARSRLTELLDALERVANGRRSLHGHVTWLK